MKTIDVATGKMMTIQELEERIGAELPEDYRRFLTEHSESLLPSTQRFPLAEKTPFGDAGLLDELATLGDFDSRGIFKFEDVGMIIIGNNLLGYPTCLCLKPLKAGHIFYYDIQQRSLWKDEQFYSTFKNLAETVRDYLRLRSDGLLPSKEEGFESFYYVASSFSEFQGLLTDEDFDT